MYVVVLFLYTVSLYIYIYIHTVIAKVLYTVTESRFKYQDLYSMQVRVKSDSISFVCSSALTTTRLTSGTARGIQGENSLYGHIHRRHIEGFKHNLQKQGQHHYTIHRFWIQRDLHFFGQVGVKHFYLWAILEVYKHYFTVLLINGHQWQNDKHI